MDEREIHPLVNDFCSTPLMKMNSFQRKCVPFFFFFFFCAGFLTGRRYYNCYRFTETGKRPSRRRATPLETTISNSYESRDFSIIQRYADVYDANDDGGCIFRSWEKERSPR